MRVERESRSEFVDIRKTRYHIRRWGNPAAPTLIMLHGWMDLSATFQFVIDAFRHDWNIIAPDWRGFGLSEWIDEPYWFAQLISDLDAILDHFSPEKPANIVGHSMGGNLAGLYAGIRQHRVARFVTLEGFGHPSESDEETVARYSRLIASVNEGVCRTVYASQAELANRLMRANPRLTPQRASFMSEHLGRPGVAGQVELAIDPWHRLVFSHLVHRVSDFMACWRAIEAPVLWVAGRESDILASLERTDPVGTSTDYHARLACFRNVREVVLEDAGHNVHHDQPEQVADLIENFIFG